jgi:hypothetical protein
MCLKLTEIKKKIETKHNVHVVYTTCTTLDDGLVVNCRSNSMQRKLDINAGKYACKYACWGFKQNKTQIHRHHIYMYLTK